MEKKKWLPIWGGFECTINRVKDDYHDQLGSCGHYTRTGDIDALAMLGISSFRYPVLWERYQPTKNTIIDWSFAKAGIETLVKHGIEPIIGLVHHGSGPAFVNFFDGSFEEGLASYASQLATEFPNVNYFTPVNEPLTTARFCGLYGHWYPHKTDDHSFCKILVSECRATVMAMTAIKRINPSAKLVQTEDLGKTYATPLLAYQAEFENERRWLSFDLIMGRVDCQHPLWGYLMHSGIEESELLFFHENKCSIDILGLNYYITSERYLDEDLEKYPLHTHGGNGRHKYADIEVVRVAHTHNTGFSQLVQEAWIKYNQPIAITEVHMHCTREEQLRWFMYIYRSCIELLSSGIDIQAVTCWALLGAYGWDKLLKEPGGNYESGAFLLCEGVLRPTALSKLIKQLSFGVNVDHPLFKIQGWWHSCKRILYTSARHTPDMPCLNNVSPLLIIGVSGTLGQAFEKICSERSIVFQGVTHSELDVSNLSQLASIIEKYKPWAIINAAGYVKVDDAEEYPDTCYNINTQGAINLAILCRSFDIKLINFSSDLVFNGQKNEAYNEYDTTDPLNVYGKSKMIAENLVMSIYPASLMIRTSAFFGPWDKFNFAYQAISSVRNGQRFSAANDIIVSPTYVPDLVNYALDLLIDDERGIWHICNDGATTWSDFARMVVSGVELDSYLIDARPNDQLATVAKRPQNSSMISRRGAKLPSLQNAIERFIALLPKSVDVFDIDLSEVTVTGEPIPISPNIGCKS
jgi:dTDP-4-dehydrorhamnose reductase